MKNLRHTLWALVGLFGLATLVVAPAAADQVILDDLIVDGSICAGFDCVNGESFGFDTLRLKENNLRIKAQDTSNSASFPTQDWQLTFNDTTNGGANKFAVDCVSPGSSTPFTIEGCAPNNSLYVDDGGRIGFGTANPVVDLHVVSGNTPTLRLEQDGSSGFGAQTWDVAGNEANFFIRDATSGSTLPFRIFPGAPSNALTIEGSTGDIGLGTTSPGAPLHVIQSGSTISPSFTPVLLLQNSAASGDAAFFTLVAGNNANSQMAFGDTDNEFAGQLLFQHNGDFFEFYTGGAKRAGIDGSTAIGQTTLLLSVDGSATLQRVSVDAANSCGAGFRCLRVPN